MNRAQIRAKARRRQWREDMKRNLVPPGVTDKLSSFGSFPEYKGPVRPVGLFNLGGVKGTLYQ